MEKVFGLSDFRANIKTYLIDFSLLLFIYFLPVLSHLFAFPIYYLDPMRIALVVALIHTSKKNTFLIAITLPLFSFFISSHPQIVKSLLLSAELLINLSLFFLFKEIIKNVFASLLLSIIISKVIYYLLKFALINFALLDDKLYSTPYYFQIISALLLSIYIYWTNRSEKKS
jgi:hypothetical protein